VYDACAAVGGGGDLLRGPYRRWLTWFLDHAGRRIGGPGTTTNLNAGLGLNYLPAFAGSDANSRPSSEYASILLTMLGPYDRAIAAGMRPLPRRLEDLARRWQERVLFGDWTDAGYVNWDSGLAYRRWHLRRYWAFAAEGLLTVAQADRLRPTASAVVRARSTLDAALALHARLLDDPGNAGAASALFGIASLEPDAAPDGSLVAARFAALAARATRLGVVGAPVASAAPAVAYGYDPDIDRIAVSTARYAAAIVAPSRVGNGGASISRLSDAAGLPLSGTGGNGPTATGFGLTVLRGRRVLLETQPGTAWRSQSARLGAGASPGGGLRPSLTSAATVDERLARATVRHRFTPDRIGVAHDLLRRIRSRVVVRFPAYGDAAFFVVVAGAERPLGDAPVPAGDLRVELRGGRGYRVRFTAVPSGATLRAVRATRAASAPLTRLTVLLELPTARGRTLVAYDLIPNPV
jgi:hypothetical protein